MVQLRLLGTVDCIHARRGANRAHASLRLSKTRAFCAQSVPSAAVRSNSNARCGWSHPCFYPPVDGARRAAQLGSFPKSRCRVGLDDRRMAHGSTAGDTLPRCGHQRHTPPPDGCGGTARATPSACFSYTVRMTRVHPTPTLLVPLEQRKPRSVLMAEAAGLFFSQRLTVVRETPKIRTKPRSEVRS